MSRCLARQKSPTQIDPSEGFRLARTPLPDEFGSARNRIASRKVRPDR